jgi:PKD repeat protein
MYASSVPYDLPGTGVGVHASFTYSPKAPVIGEEITFDASSSYDTDGYIVSYNWDFGDGSSAQGPVVTHAYTEAGKHTVTLVVTNSEGLTGSTWRVVSVEPPAVLLVHGWRGSCATFVSLEPWLEQALVDSGDFPDIETARQRVECFDPRGGGQGYAFRKGGIASAHDLESYIEGPSGFKKRMFGDRAASSDTKIDIVAHSFGGLVSRYYIEKLGGDRNVRSLTMLGTPNEGVYLANLDSWLRQFLSDWASWDMRLGSPFLDSLNTAFTMRDTAYKVIAGTGDDSFLYRDAGFPNDCIVTVASAQGPFPEVTHTYNVIHTSLPNWLCASVPTLENDISQVFPDVLSSIKRPPGGEATTLAEQPAVPQADGGAAEVGPHTGLALDTIQQGEVKTHPIPIDASSATATFMLFWQSDGVSPMLHLTLEKPDGTVIDASGPGVVYGPAGLFMDGLMVEAYDVEAPEAGTWIARVEGTTVPGEGHSYAAMAFLDSPVSLSASANPTSVLQGDVITLIAEPQEAGVPIAGATATVAVTKPDSTVQNVTLRDDGSGCDPQADDGSYCEMFTDTATAGIYSFLFQVSGTVASGPFDRQELVLVDAHVAGDAAGDPTNADDDGDGFDDEAELYVSTDPLDACPDDPGDDAWPLDVSKDGQLNVVADVLNFRGRIGATPSDPNWWQRLDFNADGLISVVGDVLMYRGRIGTSCTNP